MRNYRNVPFFCGKRRGYASIAAFAEYKVGFYLVKNFAGFFNTLWENIAGNEFSVESLVSLMCDTYDVDTDTATADIMKIIEKWRDLGLINP